MKIKNYVVGSISALAGILLMILLLVNVLLITERFLNHTNHKYGVADSLSMTEEDLKQTVHAMISYVKGDIDSPQIVVEIDGNKVEFYNKKELRHMEDVKMLMQDIYQFLPALFGICVVGIVFLLCKKDYHSIRKSVIYAWVTLLAVSSVIGIIAMINVDLVVTGFHKLFLSDSKWVLNPALDRSVWMFQVSMYKDAILMLASIIGGVALVTLLLSVLMKNKVEQISLKNASKIGKNKKNKKNKKR